MNSPDKYSGLQPYRIALDMEKEGKQLFLEAARTTKSNLARQTFEFLAKEEDRPTPMPDWRDSTSVWSQCERILCPRPRILRRIRWL
jgi:hypothetical protein